jgi:glycosyltransferase involved in cell wall biosynthesis
MIKSNISIIIPAYNESSDIGTVVVKIKNLYPNFEVIVIDDGSTDNTADIAKKAGAKVYSHPYNIGNGAAIKSGIRVASGAVIVFMDGDGQHNPEDIERMIEFFPKYDMVVGARSKENQQSLFFRSIGNKALNILASYVAKFKIQDLTSGFRAVKSDIAYNLIYLLPNTYSYPTTITLGVLRSGRSLKYIPIGNQKRKNGVSHIKLTKDGLRFLMIIIKICGLFSPFRIFFPLSVVIFVLGLSNYIFSYITSGRFTNMSLLLFATSILIFLLGIVSEQITQLRYERSEGEKFK